MNKDNYTDITIPILYEEVDFNNTGKKEICAFSPIFNIKAVAKNKTEAKRELEVALTQNVIFMLEKYLSEHE